MIYVFGDYTLDTQCYELRHGGCCVNSNPRYLTSWPIC